MYRCYFAGASFTQLTGDTLHLFGRKLELLLQVNISLSIDRHEMDVRVVDLKSEERTATLRHFVTVWI